MLGLNHLSYPYGSSANIFVPATYLPSSPLSLLHADMLLANNAHVKLCPSRVVIERHLATTASSTGAVDLTRTSPNWWGIIEQPIFSCVSQANRNVTHSIGPIDIFSIKQPFQYILSPSCLSNSAPSDVESSSWLAQRFLSMKPAPGRSVCKISNAA